MAFVPEVVVFIRRLWMLCMCLTVGVAHAVGPYTGLTQRLANTTLSLPSSLPAPTTNSYTTENAFPGISLANPIALASPPGETNRLFIAERSGLIAVITNLAAPTRTEFMNIGSKISGLWSEGGLLGLAFHPNFASNRYFYVFYTPPVPTNASQIYNRISRFETLAGLPNQADTNSEVILISQHDEAGNHNGGALVFGPEGYLYIGCGDEGGSNDGNNNSQRINKDFFSAILRIDVDKRPGSLPPNPHLAVGATTNYAIPPDNPFIGATQFNGTAVNSNAVRTEIWAPGLRNPFRIAFDEVTGELYVGDVGQGAREEVDVVQRGRNYGWKWREGKIATPGMGSPPAGFTNWADPVLDYPRSATSNYYGTVITGGRVYRGHRLPELVGHYLFSDYASGFVWDMTHDGTNVLTWRHLFTDSNLVYFGQDPRDGELLLCDLTANQVKRLVAANPTTNGLPATLADAGVFHNLTTLTPFEGIAPYELNLPFWSDGAHKTRWFSIPATNLTIGFNADLNWSTPTSAVWIKHFDLQMTNGDPASVRRLETRLLVRNNSGSGGYGVTYRWGTSLDNAVLVPAEGLDEELVINDSGIIRTQIWRYPSRAECLACHGATAGFALGFNTAQLNRDHAYAPGDVTNQLRRLAQVGYFDQAVSSAHTLPALPALTNEAISVEYRARAYLHVNCAQCHYPGGPVPSSFDLRLARPLADAGVIHGALANDLGDPLNEVIRPGVLSNSALYLRASSRSAIQMPPLGSTVADTQGMAVVAGWINGTLTNFQTYADWQWTHFSSTNDPNARPEGDPDGDGTLNDLEYLLGLAPTNGSSRWSMSGFDMTTGRPALLFERLAHRSFDVQASTNLLDPAAWRSLDTPANRAFYGNSNEVVAVEDPATHEASYYRVRIQAP
jgi:uncharacterized repeat protein (TIGR03806 family)